MDKNLQHGCLPLYIPIVVMWKANNGYDPHLNHEGDYKHKEKKQLVSNDVQALQGDKKCCW